MAAALPVSAQKPKTLFVTVGTTKFDALVHQVHTKAVLEVLAGNFGVAHVVCQVGKGDMPPGTPHLPEDGTAKYTQHGVTFETFRLRPNISECLAQADLVMSHAGEPPLACYSTGVVTFAPQTPQVLGPFSRPFEQERL